MVFGEALASSHTNIQSDKRWVRFLSSGRTRSIPRDSTLSGRSVTFHNWGVVYRPDGFRMRGNVPLQESLASWDVIREMTWPTLVTPTEPSLLPEASPRSPVFPAIAKQTHGWISKAMDEARIPRNEVGANRFPGNHIFIGYCSFLVPCSTMGEGGQVYVC